MRTKQFCIAVFLFFMVSRSVYSQPIPVELTFGNKYLSFDLSLSKKFSENSRFGFFHMNTVQIDYKDKIGNSFILQDLLTYEAIKNLKVVGGIFYGMPGFNPTAGFQYNFVSKTTMFLFAPRVNITDTPSYDFMTILQQKIPLTDKIELFVKLKMLNVFDANVHIKSYQWFRLGLDTNGTQFGLAANFDENGSNPNVQANLGFFIRKEIF